MTEGARRKTVSVVIPTYNAASFVCDAVESVLAQTYADVEVIVVDDGSTDDTVERLARYGDRVVVLRQANGGPSKARNSGIAAATGRYIAFLDADDVWVPAKLERQVAYLESHPEVGLVFGDNSVFDAEGEVLPSFLRTKRLYPELAAGGVVTDAFRKLFDENFIPLSSVVVRREHLQAAGGFDETLHSVEDRELWMRLSRITQLACLPTVLERKRVHGSNVSGDHVLSVRSRIRVIEKLQRLFPEELRDPSLGAAVELAALHLALGHSHVQRREIVRARGHYAASLRHRFAMGTLARWLITFLGASAVDRLARAKRRMVGLAPTAPDRAFEVDPGGGA